MELAQTLEPIRERSPLAAARLHRQLTAEQAGRRAGLTADEVTWLEEGRVYRFPSADDALAALLLYVTALGIDRREARELVGLPVPPRPLEDNPRGRLIGLAAIAALLLALLAAVLVPDLGRGDSAAKAVAPARALPPPWKISVDVLNGSGDINYTRRVASRIGALAYQVKRVAKADRFDYRQTSIYYEPGGEGIAVRLARQLGVTTKPLPGGDNPRRLVVIVGPAKGPG